MAHNFLGYFTDVSRVVLEVASAAGVKRYVISSEEWGRIKDWYYDDNRREDYLLTLDDAADSFTLVRLTKDSIEIRVWEASRIAVLIKNITYLCTVPVPRLIRFFTAFFLVAVSWPLIIALSFIKNTSTEILDSKVIALGSKITSLVFLLFLLFNLLYAVFKIVESSLYRYRAFVHSNESFITDTLIFNLVMLFLFVSLGGDGLIMAVEKIWKYIGIYL